MSFAILGMGSAVPPLRYAQEETAELSARVAGRTEKEALALHAVFRKTHIEGRHLVHGRPLFEALRAGDRETLGAASSGPGTAARMEEYQREALPLAAAAARLALAQSDLTARSISHLVTVSCTGFAAPGVDIGLIRALELPATVERTHVGFMGCHGALNGLRVARAIGDSDPMARVLLCAVELCSIHFHYGWDPSRVTGNALFADGAAALVGAAGKEGWRIRANGACLFPECEDAMSWKIGDHGFLMHLSPRVPGLIVAHLRPWLASWLGGHGLSIDDVASWAVHPGGPRILASVEEALELPVGTCRVSFDVLTRVGNMSSPTVLFILEELRRANAPRPCVALGFGPGLAAEAALFD